MKRTAGALLALFGMLAVSVAFATGSAETATTTTGAQPKQVIVFFSDQRDSNPADQERVRQYIVKSSGVDFNVRKTKTSDEYRNQLAIALAGKENIDMIPIASPVELADLRTRGALYKLTDLVAKYGANMKKNIDAETWKIVTDKAGDIWGIPSVNFQYQGPALEVRKDWREKLGMAPIGSVADLETYLRKVKTGDLDGNGKDDTIPMLNTDEGYVAYDEAMSYLFTDVNTNDSYDRFNNYLDDKGNIVPVPLHPGFKEYLRKMAQWHKEGLIYQETYAIKSNEIRDLIAAGRVGGTSGWYSNTFRPWETLMKSVPTAAYEVILPKTLSGQPYKIKKSDPGSPQLGVVSFSPVAEWAVKLVDWLATAKENYVTIKTGVQGQDWEWVNRDKNVLKFLVDKTNVNNTYNFAFSFFFHSPWNWRETNPTWLNATYYAAQDMFNALPGLHNPDWFVSYDFKGTPVEANAADASTLLQEAITNIIIGKRPVDDWDSVVSQYRKMYGDKYIELATAQFKAYSK